MAPSVSVAAWLACPDTLLSGAVLSDRPSLSVSLNINPGQSVDSETVN